METLLEKQEGKNLSLMKLLDWTYLILTGIYVLCLCVYNSTYVLPAYTFPDRTVFTWLLYVSIAVVFIKTLFGRSWNKTLLIACFAAAAFFLAYRTGRELFLLMIPVLAVGAIGIDYHRLLRVYVATVGSFLAVTILCAFTGVIQNIVHYREGVLRSSWGIAYVTDFSSLILFFALMLWLAWENMPDTLAAGVSVLSLVIAYYITDSRTTVLCSGFMLFFVLLHMFYKWEGAGEENGTKSTALGNGFHFLLIFAFIVFAAAFFLALATFASGSEIGMKLDRLLSNRLIQTQEIYQDQGLHLFGSNYSPVGRGGSDIPYDGIYFIDSSYPLLLIRYGVVLFAAVAGLWTWMGCRAYKARDAKLLYVMAVVAFHALSEHHFLDVQYNILAIVPFAVIPNRTGQKKKENARMYLKKYLPEIAVGLVVLTTCSLTAPIWLDRLRTVVCLNGVPSGSEKLKAVGWMLLIVLSFSGFTAGILNIMLKEKTEDTSFCRRLWLPVICIILLAAVIYADSEMIRTEEEIYTAVIEKESEAVQTLLASCDGTLYAEDAPVLYHRKNPEIGHTLWHGDDLARLKNASVLVSTEKDRQRFVDMGFLFTEISAEHGIYSNDPAAIEAMSEAGYIWTDYDSVQRDVSLQNMADLNGLTLTENGTIRLMNGEAMRAGPFLDLYQGKYEVSFCLKPATRFVGEKNTICTLRICDYLGEKVYAEENVDGSLFVNGNEQWVNLSFSASPVRSVRFQVVAEDDADLELTGLRYRKTDSLR